MAGQFELGSKHVECMKLANQTISEIQDNNPKEAAKILLEKTYGFLPADSQVYDDYLGLTVALEEIAKVAPGAASILADQVLIRELFKACKNNADAFLMGILCSESGLASINNIKTKAVQNNGQWTITGTKQICSEQLTYENYLVFAKDEEGFIRLFVVPQEQININIINKNIASAKVSLSQAIINANLNETNHVGILNNAEFEYVQTVARTIIAATSVGIAHSALIASIGVVKEVKNDEGQSISSSQNVQFTLADMFGEIEASRMLAYFSANSIDENKANIKIATMAKVKASNIAAKSSIDALHLFGNIGYIANTEFADIVLRAVDNQVKGGTNRTQMSKIYQYMLAKK